VKATTASEQLTNNEEKSSKNFSIVFLITKGIKQLCGLMQKSTVSRALFSKKY
jgi:hypothetical protein